MAGRPPETTDQQYLRLFGRSSAPVLFTSEVADRVGVTQQGAYKRLARLRDDGLLASKTANETVWWLTDAGKSELRPD